MFDPITLAMARPKEIDLDAAGFDLASFVMGGGGTKAVSNTAQMWNIINESRNVSFVCTMSGVKFTLVPCVYQEYKGQILSVCMALMAYNSGAIIYANIVLTNNLAGGTNVYATVSMNALS